MLNKLLGATTLIAALALPGMAAAKAPPPAPPPAPAPKVGLIVDTGPIVIDFRTGLPVRRAPAPAPRRVWVPAHWEGHGRHSVYVPAHYTTVR